MRKQMFYIAEDGKQFKTEKECLAYEESQKMYDSCLSFFYVAKYSSELIRETNSDDFPFCEAVLVANKQEALEELKDRDRGNSYFQELAWAIDRQDAEYFPLLFIFDDDYCEESEDFIISLKNDIEEKQDKIHAIETMQKQVFSLTEP